MSGHNKWSSIKHKKGAADAKRGKIFTKIMKELTISAKMGGGDPASNSRLRLAISHARSQNMPKDNIERAIKKGTGELEGVEYSECLFEGYGPNGVAILVEGMTDNTNRTSSDIKSILNKNNGSLGTPGSVAWIFEKKGLLLIDKKDADEEKVMDVCINAGADEIEDRGEYWEIQTTPETFEGVRDGIEKSEIAMASAEISMLPKNTVKLAEDNALKTIKLIELLEDNDDVQNVYSNHEISDEIMEKIS